MEGITEITVGTPHGPQIIRRLKSEFVAGTKSDFALTPEGVYITLVRVKGTTDRDNIYTISGDGPFATKKAAIQHIRKFMKQ